MEVSAIAFVFATIAFILMATRRNGRCAVGRATQYR